MIRASMASSPELGTITKLGAKNPGSSITAETETVRIARIRFDLGLAMMEGGSELAA